jgi:hypothetical protein
MLTKVALSASNLDSKLCITLIGLVFYMAYAKISYRLSLGRFREG